MDEAKKGGFRASANEDPHGTRAVAMSLSEEERSQLATDPTAERWATLGLSFLAAIVPVLALIRGAPITGAAIVPVAFMALAAVALAVSVTFGSRFYVRKESLEVIDWRGRKTAVPWSRVESFATNARHARAQIRVDGQLETRRATKSATPQRLVFSKAPLLIPTEERELAGGARATVGVTFAVVGLVISVYATAIGVAVEAASSIWWGLAGGGLLYLLVSAVIAYRTRLTAKRDGLHLPNRVIPWQTIEGAAPRSRSGRLEVRIYLEDDEEVTVFCGDADRAVTEILERRDIARRMRVEK